MLLGLPGMEYHLEFTQHDEGSPGPAPSRDNLLVLYFDDLAQAEIVGSRLAALGHLPVEAENPYWTENGAVTVEDPDGWRVVLMPHPSVGACGSIQADSAFDEHRPAGRGAVHHRPVGDPQPHDVAAWLQGRQVDGECLTRDRGLLAGRQRRGQGERSRRDRTAGTTVDSDRPRGEVGVPRDERAR